MTFEVQFIGEDMNKDKRERKRLTNHQVVVLSAYLGKGIAAPDILYREVSKKIGRKFDIHEWHNPEFVKEVQEAFKQDFFDMLPKQSQVFLQEQFKQIETEEVNENE
jgi:hypothetical protein